MFWENKNWDLTKARPFLSYCFGKGISKPFFYPVYGPSGLEITAQGEEPWPHHRSIWLGHGSVNGVEFWLEGSHCGRIEHVTFTQQFTEGDSAGFEEILDWKAPDGRRFLRETRRVRISPAPKGGGLLDFLTLLTPVEGEVLLGHTNHSFFSIRVAKDLAPIRGGHLVNAEGQEGESGTFGLPSPWCDFWAERGGITEGIALFDHPSNPWYPSQWFTRDYGFMSPSPFYWIDQLRIPLGERLVLRYRVYVHYGTPEEADLNTLWEAWAKTTF